MGLRGYKAAAPLKGARYHSWGLRPGGLRGYKAAAPLKEIDRDPHPFSQTRLRGYKAAAPLKDVCFPVEYWILCASPRLQSRGPIEGLTRSCYHHRYLAVSAATKPRPH